MTGKAADRVTSDLCTNVYQTGHVASHMVEHSGTVTAHSACTVWTHTAGGVEQVCRHHGDAVVATIHCSTRASRPRAGAKGVTTGRQHTDCLIVLVVGVVEVRCHQLHAVDLVTGGVCTHNVREGPERMQEQDWVRQDWQQPLQAVKDWTLQQYVHVHADQNWDSQPEGLTMWCSQATLHCCCRTAPCCHPQQEWSCM